MRRLMILTLSFICGLALIGTACSSDDGGDADTAAGDTGLSDDAAADSGVADNGASDNGTDGVDVTAAPAPTTSTTTTSTTTTTTIALPDPVEIPSGVQEMATDGSTFWLTVENGEEGAVAVVEGTPQPQYTTLIPTGFQPRGITVADDGQVWFVDKGPVDQPSFDTGRLSRIDPGTREIVESHTVNGRNPEAVVAIGTDVWVGTEHQADVLNTTTGEITDVRVIADDVDGAQRLAVGDGSLWTVDTYFSRRITRIDPTGRSIAGGPIEIQDAQTTDVAFGAGSVWVTDRGHTDANRSNTLVHRVNPSTGGRDTINIGYQGHAITADERGVYVAANDRDDAPTRSALVIIDPATNAVVETIEVPAPAIDVEVIGSIVWVVTGEGLVPYRAL